MVKVGDFIRSTQDGLILEVIEMPNTGKVITKDYPYSETPTGSVSSMWVDFDDSWHWEVLKSYNTPLWKVLND
jgi:hypothetical protein